MPRVDGRGVNNPDPALVGTGVCAQSGARRGRAPVGRSSALVACAKRGTVLQSGQRCWATAGRRSALCRQRVLQQVALAENPIHAVQAACMFILVEDSAEALVSSYV